MRDERMEYEANVFAACLLIPEDRLLREIRLMGDKFDLSSDEAALCLAKKFQVSLTCLMFRMGLLDYKKYNS